MSSFTRVLLLSAAAVLVFDAVAAGAARATGFPYASAAVGSYLIYAAAGFFGARAGGGVRMGALAGMAAGLVDATAGWVLAAAIGGPALAAYTPDGVGEIVITIIIVALLGGIMGTIGALLAKLTGHRPVSGAVRGR